MKQRDISIDILKCLAAIVVTNSHMELLYGDYSILATGGAIGDVLFFFCSGYTLLIGRDASFFNWYKRRINRIYPTIFALALVSALIFGIHRDMPTILMSGGGWFVSCIMIYYIVLWFVKRYATDKLMGVFGVAIATVIVWYAMFGFGEQSHNNMYGNTYFKWCHYFLFMLLGASVGLRRYRMKDEELSYPPQLSIWRILIMLIISIISFYGLFWFNNREGLLWDSLQMMSLVPLAGVCWYFYQLCNTDTLTRAYNHKIIGPSIRFIGGLCLEIYLIQRSLYTDKMNGVFPLNIIIMFLIILVAAYLLRCVARVWAQTFKDDNYDWRAIIKPYN